MEMREKNTHTIIKTAKKYPQESYTAVVCVIQSKWIFLQCLTNIYGNYPFSVTTKYWSFTLTLFLVVITQLLIHQGHIRSDREIPQGSDRWDKRGDVRIQGLWDIRTDAIIDVVIGNTDTVTYRFDPTITLLDR